MVEKKGWGYYLKTQKIADPDFIRAVFLKEDEALSALFLNYLPAPKKNLFPSDNVPRVIKLRDQEMVSFLVNAGKQLPMAEKQLMRLQRKFRVHQRKTEELNHISYRNRREYRRDMTEDERLNEAKALIEDASKPYTPECNDTLAERIMDAAKAVTLFDTVKHLTAAPALKSIFDEGLYGRKTLISNYMKFKKAALSTCDINAGDANVICLGAQDIDPLAKHGMTLTFDANIK